MAAREGRLPLEGIRILDFTVAAAGPYGTQFLAYWGAEVIRVESIKHLAAGTRGLLARPPKEMLTARSAYADNKGGERPWNRLATFNDYSRNKLSMTLDLTRPEGQEVLERLIRISDGLIENNVPVSMEKMGITWERLSAINPLLVMIRMPAYGLTGPYKDYRTWGNHMEAMVGHPLIRAYPDLDLDRAAVGYVPDVAGGVGQAFAFLVGLRRRRRAGRGLLIELATAENFTSYLGDFVMDYTMNGRLWERQANQHPSLAPHNAYPCRGENRWVNIVCRDDRDWRALCQTMERPELAQDPRFRDGLSRWEHRREVDGLLTEWTRQRDADAVTRTLQAAGIPAGVVMNERDVDEDPHINERGFWEEVTHPEAGTHRYPALPWKASKTPVRTRRHAPRLGEDNEYVYKTLLGISDEEYRRYEEQGHIGMDFDPSIP